MKLNPWPWAVGWAVVLTALLSRTCTPDPSPVLNDTRWRDSLRARELNFEVDSAVRVEAAVRGVSVSFDIRLTLRCPQRRGRRPY